MSDTAVRQPVVRGADTVSWKIQREIVAILAWGPAILLQIAHPLVARGVADHSTFRRLRWGRMRRFQHTLRAMLRLTFGTEDEALAAVAGINAIHDRVHGHLDVAAGIFSPGTPYSAHDPALLAWVHATLVDMNVRVYERYVGALALDERDRYCAEASLIAPRLGIPEGHLPTTHAALERYIDRMLTSGAITVTDTARSLARDVVYPPGSLLAAPVVRVMRLATIGLLPPAIRQAYGFVWRASDERAFRRSARVIRALLPLTPRVMRHWPAARHAIRTSRRCPLAR